MVLAIRGPRGTYFHCSVEPRVQEVGHGSQLTGHFLGEQSNICSARMCVLLESSGLSEVRFDLSGVYNCPSFN